MAFGKKRFGDILGNVKNKITDSMKNDVRDLRNDEFKSQMNQERQKAENQQLWDQYKRTGEKIDVPGFDATVQSLPENDVNEKEIKINPTPQTEPNGTSSYIPKQENPEWDLENLAGNGLSEPEPKEPTGTSMYLPNEQNEEMELENLAGNGIEPEPEKTLGTSAEMPRQSDEEWDLEDLAGNGQRPSESSMIEEPEFEGEPSEMEEPDVPPELDDDAEENAVSDEEVANTPDPEGNKDPTVVDKKLENKENQNEEKNEPTKEKDKDGKNEQPEEGNNEPTKEKVKTKDAPVNDDTDLVKRGSGVSVNDIVDRSAIPHYDYLSFFR